MASLVLTAAGFTAGIVRDTVKGAYSGIAASATASASATEQQNLLLLQSKFGERLQLQFCLPDGRAGCHWIPDETMYRYVPSEERPKTRFASQGMSIIRLLHSYIDERRNRYIGGRIPDPEKPDLREVVASALKQWVSLHLLKYEPSLNDIEAFGDCLLFAEDSKMFSDGMVSRSINFERILQQCRIQVLRIRDELQMEEEAKIQNPIYLLHFLIDKYQFCCEKLLFILSRVFRETALLSDDVSQIVEEALHTNSSKFSTNLDNMVRMVIILEKKSLSDVAAAAFYASSFSVLDEKSQMLQAATACMQPRAVDQAKQYFGVISDLVISSFEVQDKAKTNILLLDSVLCAECPRFLQQCSSRRLIADLHCIYCLCAAQLNRLKELYNYCQLEKLKDVNMFINILKIEIDVILPQLCIVLIEKIKLLSLFYEYLSKEASDLLSSGLRIIILQKCREFSAGTIIRTLLEAGRDVLGIFQCHLRQESAKVNNLSSEYHQKRNIIFNLTATGLKVASIFIEQHHNNSIDQSNIDKIDKLYLSAAEAKLISSSSESQSISNQGTLVISSALESKLSDSNSDFELVEDTLDSLIDARIRLKRSDDSKDPKSLTSLAMDGLYSSIESMKVNGPVLATSTIKSIGSAVRYGVSYLPSGKR